MVSAVRGHRVLPHTADVIVEAWGPDLTSCCEEAVAGMAALYVDAARADGVEPRRVRLTAGTDESVLLDLVEEVIFILDTAEGVPVGARVARSGEDGLEVDIVMARRESVTATGAVPKGVSRSELEVTSGAGEVRCRFLVDV